MAAGDTTGGLRAFDEAIELAADVDRRSFIRQRDLLETGLDIDTGEHDRAAARLATIFDDYRQRGQTLLLRNRPDVAARIADFALSRGIESDFVRMLIERNALAAPAGASSSWPFRLRVRALGGFELIRDGAPMRFAGKAQQRPLDLLKMVIALGGEGVESAAVTLALWPEADGAAAKTSFDAALFRLRKLLDIEGAITLAGGKLSLAPERVWTDVRAIEHVLERVASAAARRENPASLARAARELLTAYPGPLLGDQDEPWIAKPRDLLRARVLRALAALGEALEAARDWDNAIDVYRRGLESDNLAEPFYRGLMRCLTARGEHAEALVAFRRCRELLSIVLGQKPSAETERLFRDISSGRSIA
jgi:DNA-binding SARP family transcriptional activator